MFIAYNTNTLCAPAERHVLGDLPLHAAPTERDRLGIWGYKHVAPPEQGVAPPEQEPRYRR
jgi:hypothetical protein